MSRKPDDPESPAGENGAPHSPMHIFGPVPSRRLGRSLGIDLVPYKTCTFDCIYCDLGKTTFKTASRNPYVSAAEIRRELELSLSTLERKPDFLTLSGSGEPTLNQNLGEIVRTIKDLSSIPLAVITNGSLLSIEEVREGLARADVVLPSLDAVDETTFHWVNRPHPSLTIEAIISGLLQFRKQYRGQIWLEVVFCRGINDDRKEIERLKGVVEKLQPERIQLNTPVRPPAEEFAYPLTTGQLEQIRQQMGERAEIISEFASSMEEESNCAKDTEITNLLKRRPCTAEDISQALGLHLEEVLKHLGKLTEKGILQYRIYQHHCYFEGASSRRGPGVEAV